MGGVVWRGSAAELFHMSQCAGKVVISVIVFTLLVWLERMDISPTRCLSPTAEVVYILCFAMSYFANQIQPVCINRFGYSV